jgi:mono/diheme cytochrome c family protein
MRRILLRVFLLTLVLSTLCAAQTSSRDKSLLNDRQILGRRLYQQRCGVCHTPPTLTSKVFGPVLYKDLVAGNEAAFQAVIGNGSRRMPGFKYELQPSEISAIVEYVKTVPKPTAVGLTGDNEHVRDQ